MKIREVISEYITNNYGRPDCVIGTGRNRVQELAAHGSQHSEGITVARSSGLPCGSRTLFTSAQSARMALASNIRSCATVCRRPVRGVAMRVGHFVHGLNPFGTERLLELLLRYRGRDCDDQFVVTCHDGPMRSVYEALGVPVRVSQEQAGER